MCKINKLFNLILSYRSINFIKQLLKKIIIKLKHSFDLLKINYIISKINNK